LLSCSRVAVTKPHIPPGIIYHLGCLIFGRQAIIGTARWQIRGLWQPGPSIFPIILILLTFAHPPFLMVRELPGFYWDEHRNRYFFSSSKPTKPVSVSTPLVFKRKSTQEPYYSLTRLSSARSHLQISRLHQYALCLCCHLALIFDTAGSFVQA
jgi:hypothetical protein